MRLLSGRWRLMLLLITLLAPLRADAVILYARRLRNTTPPAGSLTNAGWQWEGKWGNFLGTPISKNAFITAEHIGGTVGGYFEFGGRRYKTTATYDDPQSDLQVWHIHGRFDTWAPLLTDYSDIGKNAVIFGRGTQRGSAISLNGEPKGWLWGTDDHVQSWGMNRITSSTYGRADEGGARVKGARLVWAFDRDGLSQEAAISAGDSGGGVFILSGGKWRLAGINFSTQAQFSYPDSTQILSGALFDSGGLMAGDQLIPDTAADVPALSFATRISTRATWISDVLAGRIEPTVAAPSSTSGVPEPAAEAFAALAVIATLHRRRRWRS